MLTVSRTPSTSLGSEASGMDHHTWKRVLWSDESVFQVFFWEEWTPCAPDQRRKGSSRLLPATSPKARVCHGMGLCQCPCKGNLHFCDGTINAEKYIEILEHNMLPSRRHLSRDVHAYFNRQCKTTFCTHYKVLAAEEEGYGYLTGLPAVPTCLQ